MFARRVVAGTITIDRRGLLNQEAPRVAVGGSIGYK
jgi:hypothetical protein